MDEKLKNRWLDALVKLYEGQLLLNKNIMKGSKKEKVESYLDVLEHARQEVMKSEDIDQEDIFKSFYHDLYVIKQENIPYSVYESEQRNARELGHGTFEITDEYIAMKNGQIIDDQIVSLDKWLDYFLYDEEAKFYKSWEIYWVLEGLQKLGKYDKQTGTFTKRDKTTIYPFPEVNKVAIFNTLNLMEQYLKTKTGPNELKGALGQSNFKQLYEYSLKKLFSSKKQKNNEIKGIWIKYEQYSDYNVMRNDLKDKMTGWCIEAGESFARDYLYLGDFYIYYTIDESGEYTNPRIAIRTENGKIAEIRGILDDQNMEPEMLPVLDEKLDEFPDKDEYNKKKDDMYFLTQIERKVNSNIDLTVEELKFLYEFDDEIEGFGWERDPRIEEIKFKRDFKKDLSFIYGCPEDQIAISNREVDKNTKVFHGDIYLKKQDYKNLRFPPLVTGSIYFRHLQFVERIIFPQKTLGDISLKFLASAHHLKFSKFVRGGIDLSHLYSVDILELPEFIGGAIKLDSLKVIEKVILPKSLVGVLRLPSLRNTVGLEFPEELTYSIYLADDIIITPENVDEFRRGKKR